MKFTFSTLGYVLLMAMAFPVFAAPSNDETYKKLEAFSKVLGYIEDHYIEKVSTTQLIDDALRGITSSLDPHTTYLPPDLYKQMKVDTSGEFGGVGIELGYNQEKELVVIAPTEDGPAIKQGVLPGDRILSIDGKSTANWSLMETVKKVRGARGTTVRMMLQHKDDPKAFEVILKREIMHIQSVEYKLLNDGIGYIQVKSFQEKTDQEVERAFAKLQAQASKSDGKLQGLILDLRNDPGGLLDQAVAVADLFLDDGVIVSTRGRDNLLQGEAKAQVQGTLPYVPMITIINEGTASAAEIVAGALQDLGRSPLLGTPSFGKGSVQNIIDLEDGSALKITIARYFTPKGRPIQNVGNQPDIYVSSITPVLDEIDMVREKDLQGRIETIEESGLQKTKDKTGKTEPLKVVDIQLKTAQEYLKSSSFFQNKEAKRQ
jgi:carboxyl-terminal processing protease